MRGWLPSRPSTSTVLSAWWTSRSRVRSVRQKRGGLVDDRRERAEALGFALDEGLDPGACDGPAPGDVVGERGEVGLEVAA